MSNINKDTDIVLKPLSGLRGKRADTLKGCHVEAHIFLSDGNGNDQWNHPVVTLEKVRVYDDGERSAYTMLDIRYQRTNVNMRIDGWTPRERARGFIKGPGGCWSYSYAAKISAEMSSMDLLSTGLKLLERASEAVRDYDQPNGERLHRALCKVNDQLLTLIVGFRKIGVTVVVHNARLHTNAAKLLRTGYSLVRAA